METDPVFKYSDWSVTDEMSSKSNKRGFRIVEILVVMDKIDFGLGNRV